MDCESLPTIADIVAQHPGWLDEAISTDEASAFVGTPVATLETHRFRGGGPAFMKLGKRVFYRRRDLIAWMDAHRRSSTAEAAD